MEKINGWRYYEETICEAVDIITFLFIYLIVGCSSAHIRGGINSKMLGQNPKIAVAYDDMLAQAITAELLMKGFTIVERTSLNRVLSEMIISASGLTEEDKLVSAGKLLNVDALLFVKMVPSTGSPGKIESAVVKLVDVQKGELLGAMNYQNGRAGASGSPAGAGAKESLPESAERISREILKGFGR